MNENKFTYTYSAPTKDERREIEYIRNQYVETNEEVVLKHVKKLDKRVRLYPRLLGICVGTIGTLVFGTGLTMILLWDFLVYGIVVMLLGCVLAAIAYPIFRLTYKKNMFIYGSEIKHYLNSIIRKQEKN